MNTLLQEKIAALGGSSMPMMMAQGGEVETDFVDVQDPQVAADLMTAQTEAPPPPDQALQQTILSLMEARDTAEDPTEARVAEGLAEAAEVGTQAPLGDMALELAQAGRGEDVLLAHLTPGEVVLPPQMMADPQFESAVEKRFLELDLDPEAYIAGSGIASLNPITGLEEFGFFKKTWKSIKKVGKKVIKPIANVAQFIPGPWQAPAALISKGYAVYDAASSGNPMAALLAAAAPMPQGGGSFSQSFSNFLNDPGGAISRGIGSIGEYIMPGADGVGLIDNLGQTIFGSDPGDILYKAGQNNPAIQEQIRTLGQAGMTPDKILVELQKGGLISPYAGAGVVGSVGEFLMPGVDDKGLYTNVTDFFGNVLQPGQQPGQQQPGGGNPLGGLFGGGGGFPGGTLGALGVAALLGKLAYDEAKDRKGVPLTPLTQMNAAGRYNIEAEIARRMGQQAPNPVEFGLLPQGTMPQLMGGRTSPPPMQAAMGGPVRGYKDGGDIDGSLFMRMTGDIDGMGSEISDDIPAMLSDGEFVMTGRAVRGAGAFDMKNNDGIVTLKPAKKEDRERGTDLMYKMMDLFAEFADAPQARRA
jgi:hypothetical protein